MKKEQSPGLKKAVRRVYFGSMQEQRNAMEKRSTRRRRISTSIGCSHLNSVNFGEPVDGRLKNRCLNGLYAELGAYFKAGTVLVARTTGSSCRHSGDEGFRSLAVAEVKWSKSKLVEGENCYATGLKYMMIYACWSKANAGCPR
jgi:hypothetical protein